jgi:hypothetical protein
VISVARRQLLMTAMVLLLAVTAVVPRSPAHSTGNLTVLSRDRSAFENYDFESQGVSSGKVDWTMDLLFYNASQAKVNAVLNSQYPNGGGAEYARMYQTYYNNNNWFWDANSGRKDSVSACYGTDRAHYRVYARPDTGQNYNVVWGYWTAASTHKDHLECSLVGGSWFGYSNDAENNVASDARFDLGARYVKADSHKWHNPEYCPTKSDPHSMKGACRRQGDGIWQSDGYATAIYLP